MTDESIAQDLFQVMPPLSSDEFDELKADIAARGVMVPVEYDEAGNILDGHHRIKACAELGIKEWPSVVRLGLDAQAKTLHAIKLNCARRHLTTAGKQQAIQKALQAAPEKSDRQLARAIGVSHPTVATARKELEQKGELVKFTSCLGADGKERPRQSKPISIAVAKPDQVAKKWRNSPLFRRNVPGNMMPADSGLLNANVSTPVPPERARPRMRGFQKLHMCSLSQPLFHQNVPGNRSFRYRARRPATKVAPQPLGHVERLCGK